LAVLAKIPPKGGFVGNVGGIPIEKNRGRSDKLKPGLVNYSK
jgi:hypothetical protein